METGMNYWHKQSEKPLFPDIEWNKPEQKTGNLLIIGGNSSGFMGVNAAVAATNDLPLKSVSAYLPDSLKSKLPPTPNLFFAPSTDSGGFAKSAKEPLFNMRLKSDKILLVGDFGKNSETAVTLADLAMNLEKPLLLTRDTIDLVLEDMTKIIEKPALTLLATLPQLQKLFRALYYPKVILLSMPLTPLLETLHKFTITYETTIITLHQNQIIIAKNGEVITTPLTSTAYTPLTLWSGALAAKIAAYQIWNPEKPLEAASTSLLA
jgi:hypothetical protein